MKNQPYPLNKVKSLTSMIEVVEYAAKKYKNKTAFTYRSGKNNIDKKSYFDFLDDIKIFSNSLLEQKIKNKRIALYSENSYEWLVIYFSVVRTGNIIIPLDKELNAEDVCSIVRDGDVDIILYSNALKDNIKIKNSEILQLDILNIYEKFMEIGRLLIKSNKDYLNKLKNNSDRISTILYTSGTTGIPKGVMLKEKSIVMDMIDCSRIYGYEESLLLVLPLHHSFGITAAILGPLFLGTEIIINRGLKEIPKDFTTFKPTDTVLVPLFIETLYNRIWLTARKEKKDKLLKMLITFSNALYFIGIDLRRKLFKPVLESFGGNLQYIISGAAPLNPKYIKYFRAFGIEIRQGYGITESSPVVAVNRRFYYRDNSVGQIIPNMHVKIVNPDENGIGEIHLKGPHIMQGYYKNKKETNRVLKEGWFNTEDLGYIDDEKFLYIQGRKKNLIILSNGKNIAAEELEQVISEIDLVKEVIVTSENDKIIANIFPDYDLAKEKEVDNIKNYIWDKIMMINKTLPLYKNIGDLNIREVEFSKTTTRKIKR